MSSSWVPTWGDLGAVEHDDPVGHAHGAEAVRDQDRERGGAPRDRSVALEQRVLSTAASLRRGR